MNTSSLSPLPADAALKRRKDFWLRAIWISLACWLLSALIGLLITVFSMMISFQIFEASGAADPAQLAEKISFALIPLFLLSLVSTVSFFFLIAALIRFFTLPKLPEPQVNPLDQTDRAKF